MNDTDNMTLQRKSSVGNQAVPFPNATGRTERVTVESPFAGRSRLFRRTPPPSPTSANVVSLWEVNSEKTPVELQKRSVLSGVESDMNTNTQKSGDIPKLSEYTSPKETYIHNMRKSEEDQLTLCREIMRKMKEATKVQPNISKVVKNGLADLEEALDVIVSSRKSWIAAERQMRRSAKRTAHENGATPQSTSTQQPINEKPQTPCGNKRNASSPAEPEAIKRAKDVEGEDPWTLVQRKKPSNVERFLNRPGANDDATPKQGTSKKKRRKNGKKRRLVAERPEALLIKIGEGKTYAEVLGTIRKDLNPEALNTEIKSVRRTMRGDVLLELGSNTKDKANFRDAVINVLGDTFNVRCLEPKITLEIKDLDCLTTEDEVKEAIKRDLKNYTGDLKVSISRANSREQRTAYVEIAERDGLELIKIGRIKIGWVYCKVYRRAIVTRCYKCLGFGHPQRYCKGPDRRKSGTICFKCGEKGHFQKDCTAEPECFVCADRGMPPEQIKHVRGTGACQVYKEALDKAKKNLK